MARDQKTARYSYPARIHVSRNRICVPNTTVLDSHAVRTANESRVYAFVNTRICNADNGFRIFYF